MGLRSWFRGIGHVGRSMLASVVLLTAFAGLLVVDTAEARLRRDVSRMVFNENLGLLEEVRRSLGEAPDSLERLLAASPVAPRNRPYIVVSIEEHRLWYRRGDSTLFTAQVATGSGKVLERSGGPHWRFETPRGRLLVQAKDLDPEWVPPDWHFIEQARKRGLGVIRLDRGQQIPLADGGVLAVAGSDVVRKSADGRSTVAPHGEGRELVANGNIVIPPFGTRQRRYPGVLGTHRLSLGDGYALHGTNQPETIGRSVSHGCIRLRNEDIARLWEMVEVGTPVYVY